MTTPEPRFGTLLVLGRISNLPTVWSNCLAAWLLNGGQSWNNFYVISIAATLLYIGGMFLNDAFDAEFDRQFRKERPIPSGKISVRAVWLIGGTMLLLGWLMLLLLGASVAIVGVMLVGAIFLYDLVHKRVTFAPLLMAMCRSLLYMTAATATLRSVGNVIIWHALALAVYITGLSYLARVESGQGMVRRWPLLLLAAPLLANVLLNSSRDVVSWIASAILLAWMVWSLRGMFGSRENAQHIGKSVAGLLAGIVLVDWAAVPRMADEFNLVFIGLFVLALVLQRKIPAT